jgi:hypothetical protein
MALGIKYPSDSQILSLTEETDILSSTVLAMIGAQPAKISGSALRGGPQGIQTALRTYNGTGPGQIVSFSPAIVPKAIVAVRQDAGFLFWCSLFPSPVDILLNHPLDYGYKTGAFSNIGVGSLTFGPNSWLCFPGTFYSLVIFGE